MQSKINARAELQGLLGTSATDDAHWRDLRDFEAAALPAIVAEWQLDQAEELPPWRVMHPYGEAEQALQQRRTTAAIERVSATLGARTSRCAAAFYLSPQLWQPAYTTHPRQMYHLNYAGQLRSQLLAYVAGACLARAVPADWSQRLAQRILTLCLTPGTNGAPDLAACVSHLLQAGQPQGAEFLDALTLGEWPAAWRALTSLAQASAPEHSERLIEFWRAVGSGCAVALFERLHHQGRLEAAHFRKALAALPGSLPALNTLVHAVLSERDQALYAAFRADVRRLIDTAVWELLCDLRPETWPVLAQLHALSGGRVLLRLVEEIARQGFTALPIHYHYRTTRLDGLLARLLAVLRRREDDDSAALIGLLRQLDPPAMLAALPHAEPYTRELCAALGWAGAYELIALLRRVEAASPARATDPAAGSVRREEIVALATAIEELHLRTLLDVFAGSCPAAVLLVRAALGWNRTDVRRSFGRRNQLAARALGLLPLERPDDLIQRYLALRRYEREANSSGAGRKAYERAAAQAGLANLAAQAGFADATRLEWAMEDRLGAETTAIGRQWAIEGYSLTLALHERGPALEVRGPKRALKRIPQAVRRDYLFREVSGVLEQAQDQDQRYRRAFQNAMRNQQPLVPDELALLGRNPLAAALLERLLLIDSAGAVGLFRAADMSLEGVYGERIKIAGSATIAHASTLLRLGLLGDWQAEIVRRQVIQPFKQIFREIYLLTPAEIEARYASARLAGRRLKGRQATAVLANLGWLIDGYGEVRKPFYELGYGAQFETGAYYGGDEGDGATTGTLAFWPLRHDPANRGERRIPLTDIPAAILSEVLRDLDQVTAIAHQSDEQETSQEVLRQRGDLVRALVGALGLAARVQVDEPFVYVQGERAGYRVHLATGAIYMSNGQYLCIVTPPKQQKAIYLPYADGGEPIGSEIVSKVLLLANDRGITDSTILAQLPEQRKAA